MRKIGKSDINLFKTLEKLLRKKTPNKHAKNEFSTKKVSGKMLKIWENH